MLLAFVTRETTFSWWDKNKPANAINIHRRKQNPAKLGVLSPVLCTADCVCKFGHQPVQGSHTFLIFLKSNQTAWHHKLIQFKMSKSNNSINIVRVKLRLEPWHTNLCISEVYWKDKSEHFTTNIQFNSRYQETQSGLTKRVGGGKRKYAIYS